MTNFLEVTIFFPRLIINLTRLKLTTFFQRLGSHISEGTIYNKSESVPLIQRRIISSHENKKVHFVIKKLFLIENECKTLVILIFALIN